MTQGQSQVRRAHKIDSSPTARLHAMVNYLNEATSTIRCIRKAQAEWREGMCEA